MKGIITKGVGGLYTVDCSGEKFECRARGIFRKEKLTPLTGDSVEIEAGVITDILPRKNSLSRPPCANIDKLFIVSAVSDPEPNLYQIDKMMTIAYYYGIEPVLVFNKTDLDDKLGICGIYASLPVKSFEICANTGKGDVDGIRSLIKDCTVVLSGLSGVGKSSLMNMLDPDIHAQTGDISRATLRGKHTTRTVELFDLCGGHVMDTPGFSSLLFEYFDIKDRSCLESCFPEFEQYLGDCRFDDCHHIKEPGCAVTQALRDGNIQPTRYESYMRMYDEIGPYEAWKDKA